MSLDYDLSKIKDREAVTVIYDTEDHKVLNPVTQNIIFGCLSTYIGEITKDNCEEWFARYTIWNQTHGYENYLTMQDVRNHIGLRTNVFPKKPMAQWFKEHIWRDTLYDVRNDRVRMVKKDA